MTSRFPAGTVVISAWVLSALKLKLATPLKGARAGLSESRTKAARTWANTGFAKTPMRIVDATNTSGTATSCSFRFFMDSLSVDVLMKSSGSLYRQLEHPENRNSTIWPQSLVNKDSGGDSARHGTWRAVRYRVG